MTGGREIIVVNQNWKRAEWCEPLRLPAVALLTSLVLVA
jgi:hypothetical protein